MAAERKGWVRRILGAVWWGIDGTRRVVVNLLFAAIVVAVVAAAVSGGPPALKERTVLVMDLSGRLVEQRPGSTRDALLSQAQGEDDDHVVLRDVIAALDAAAKDPKIERVLLLPGELSGGGLPAQREVALALERFKAAGKEVIAWATDYDQRQYFVAAHATQVYVHPMGGVMVQGYGRLRNYYREAFDRLGVSANVVRVGKYKNAGEPFFASAPSKETLESEALLFDAMWAQWTAAVEKARRLEAGAVMKGVDALPGSLQAVGGDVGQLMLQLKLVDALKTRDEVDALLRERGVVEDKGGKGQKRATFRQVGWRDYLARQKPAPAGDAVGVIVAEGEIGDGVAPPGRIGGRSTAELVRRAREDERIKAVVLRVNSPGGSALGSEMIRRELELTRAAGKPVVVSMGDLAASGGYWISMAADEVISDPATITGSIGVFAMLPTAQGLVDKLSVRTGGHGTTWLANAYDPRKALDPRFEAMVQSAIGRIYADFIGKAAAARKVTPQKIDEVAQGRVWTGGQALERGLIDRTGQWADALKAARTRGQLAEEARVVWLEREPGRFEKLMGWFKAGAADVLRQAGLAGWLAGTGGGHGAALAVGAAVVSPAVTDSLLADLSWLAEVAQRRQPYAATVHCLCTPVE